MTSKHLIQIATVTAALFIGTAEAAAAGRPLVIRIKPAQPEFLVPSLQQVARTLEETEGVEEVVIDTRRGVVRARIDTAVTPVAAVVGALEEEGFVGGRTGGS